MAWELTGNARTNPANNFLGTTDNSSLVIKINGVEALRIDTSHNVGIGTTAPGARLTIDVSGEGNLALRLMSGPNAFLDITPTSAGGRFQTVLNTVNNRDLVILPGTGNVGIGTSSPVTTLHIIGHLALDPQGNPVLFTGSGSGELHRYLELINSPGATSASGLKAGGVLVSDSYNYANPGKNDLVVKGNVGIGTSAPATTLHVIGSLALDPQGSPVLFTGTGSGELHRYLQLLNSPGFTSASGLKAGGVLIADDYTFANPGKNDLVVKGTVQAGDVLLTQGDCAEDFDLCSGETAEPGSVMVIDQEGTLRESHSAYDPKVAGVISGAGGRKPAITLDKQAPGRTTRMPIALNGKVYCKVDATHGPIDLGDLLVTSPTRAHAMRATDPARAFGAVIGKALERLEGGRGLIPILVALQ